VCVTSLDTKLVIPVSPTVVGVTSLSVTSLSTVVSVTG